MFKTRMINFLRTSKPLLITTSISLLTPYFVIENHTLKQKIQNLENEKENIRIDYKRRLIRYKMIEENYENLKDEFYKKIMLKKEYEKLNKSEKKIDL